MNPDDATALRMRSIARLARPTAHEVRGVLSAVRLHLELLASTLEPSDDPATHQRQQRYLGVLQDECRRLERVTGAFLDLLAPSGASGETDLAALIAGVVEGARPLATERRVRLEAAESAPMRRRLADREAARQRLLDAVLDVLANAPAGSAVRVELVPGGERASLTVDDGVSTQVSLGHDGDRV